MSKEEKEEYESAISNGKYIANIYGEGSIGYHKVYSMINYIDKLQKELDNRIPISEIEKILEATKQLREKEIKELGMSLRGSAVDILENILKNYKE